ncbi:MAG: glycosyltransferase family 4 protein [bacterium]|nr:glycosyltransferase family 4 protein [bacterium]
MKKTLIISLEFPPYVGGVATYVHDLADALDPERTVVLADLGENKGPTREKREVWDKEKKYKIVRKRLLFPKFIWPRWTRLIWHVWRIVRKEKIEVIFVQHVLPVGYAGIVMKKLFKIPFLLFSHGTDLIAGTATVWKRVMVTKVSNHADQIIFNSYSLQSRYLRVLPQFENKSFVLYPCPEPKFLEPPSRASIDNLRKQYALEGKQTLLSVSRLDEGKGFLHMIRYMSKILEQVPNLVWFIIGGGIKSDEIVKSIRKHNLQNIVRFVGEIPHEALHPYYYTADIFVLLTHPDEGREEGLGLVFLEASAAGLPIIAGRSGGVPEAVLDGRTGLIVEATNEKQVVDATLKLLREKAYGKQLGKAAKERMIDDFQWHNQIKLLDPWILTAPDHLIT